MYVIVVQISWATALAAAVLCSTQHTSAQYGLPAQVQPLQRQPTKANSITTLDASMGVMASADAAVSGDKGVSHNVAVSQDNSNQQTIQYSRGSAPPLRQQQRQTQRHGPPGSSRSSRYMQMPLDVRLDYDVDDEDAVMMNVVSEGLVEGGKGQDTAIQQQAQWHRTQQQPPQQQEHLQHQPAGLNPTHVSNQASSPVAAAAVAGSVNVASVAGQDALPGATAPASSDYVQAAATPKASTQQHSSDSYYDQYGHNNQYGYGNGYHPQEDSHYGSESYQDGYYGDNGYYDQYGNPDQYGYGYDQYGQQGQYGYNQDSHHGPGPGFTNYMADLLTEKRPGGLHCKSVCCPDSYITVNVSAGLDQRPDGSPDPGNPGQDQLEPDPGAFVSAVTVTTTCPLADPRNPEYSIWCRHDNISNLQLGGYCVLNCTDVRDYLAVTPVQTGWTTGCADCDNSRTTCSYNAVNPPTDDVGASEPYYRGTCTVTAVAECCKQICRKKPHPHPPYYHNPDGHPTSQPLHAATPAGPASHPADLESSGAGFAAGSDGLAGAVGAVNTVGGRQFFKGGSSGSGQAQQGGNAAAGGKKKKAKSTQQQQQTTGSAAWQ